MDVIKVLEKQKQVLRNIQEVLVRENEILIKEDGDKLPLIIKEKTSLIDKLNSIEEERLRIISDKEIDETFIAIKEEIKNLVKSITRLQGTNRLLTEQSMNYSKKMIDIFVNHQRKQSNTYKRDGKIIGKPREASMINKSI